MGNITTCYFFHDPCAPVAISGQVGYCTILYAVQFNSSFQYKRQTDKMWQLGNKIKMIYTIQFFTIHSINI